MATYTIVGGEMDEEAAAAALAAIACVLEEEAAAQGGERPVVRRPGWEDATRLVAQGLIPVRMPVSPRWGSIERLRRAGRASSGVVGQ